MRAYIVPALLLLFGAIYPQAFANTITVDNGSSGSIANACTLQDAVAAANTNMAVNDCVAGAAGLDTIVFAPGITSISLSAAMSSANATCTFGLAVTEDLTIDGGAVAGSGVPKVTIQRSSVPGTPNFGIVGASLYNCGTIPTKKLNLTLAGIAIGNGNNAGNGGGVAADILTVSDSAVTSSHANDGGGVYAFTSLVMANSTVSGNSSSSSAGIATAGAAAISGSTISGNAGIGIGGGPLTIDNSTISGNTGDGVETDSIAAYFVTIMANSGAGIRLDVSSSNNAVAEFDETLIAGNASGAPFVHDLETSASRPITGTYDYFGTLSAVALNDIDPNMLITGCASLNLGALANNGGGTQTHALLAGSCLIDAGGIVSPGGFLFAHDQRGSSFPRFFNTRADIGAYEYQGAPAAVNGACGSDNGLTLGAPPVNLCSAGTASSISGSGHPWSWTCAGTSGGTTATCSATLALTPVASVILASGLNPAPTGQDIVLTATVSGNAATPSGVVTFMDGSSTLGSAPTTMPLHAGAKTSAVLNAAGVASLTLASLSVGTHAITAQYAGDGVYSGATSNILNQVVTAAAVSSTVSAPALGICALAWLAGMLLVSGWHRRAHYER